MPDKYIYIYIYIHIYIYILESSGRASRGLDSFQILESLEAQEPGNEVEGVILLVMATFGNIFGYLS